MAVLSGHNRNRRTTVLRVTSTAVSNSIIRCAHQVTTISRCICRVCNDKSHTSRPPCVCNGLAQHWHLRHNWRDWERDVRDFPRLSLLPRNADDCWQFSVSRQYEQSSMSAIARTPLRSPNMILWTPAVSRRMRFLRAYGGNSSTGRRSHVVHLRGRALV